MKKQMLTAAAFMLGLSFSLTGAAHAGQYVPNGTPSYSPAQTGTTATSTWPLGTMSPPPMDSKSASDPKTHMRSWYWQPDYPVPYWDPAPSAVNYKWTGQVTSAALSVSIAGSNGTGKVTVTLSNPGGSVLRGIGPTSSPASLPSYSSPKSADLLNQVGGSNITASVMLMASTQAQASANSPGTTTTATSGSSTANKVETFTLDLAP